MNYEGDYARGSAMLQDRLIEAVQRIGRGGDIGEVMAALGLNADVLALISVIESRAAFTANWNRESAKRYGL